MCLESAAIMFLRCKVRRKDGKQHRYWSVVENTRTARGRVVQRHVLYLGEINDTQELAWRRSIEVLEEGATQPRTLSLFPEDRFAGALADASIVHVKLSQLQLRRPRQWGACWLALMLWRELQLDQFWSKRLGVSRKEPALAKAGGRIGIRCCSCWSPIVCWRRAANGACIVSGFSAARWPICWAKMPGWRKSTSCTAVTTDCWGTSKRSSIIWWGGGAIYSTSATTCCFTTSRAPISRRILHSRKGTSGGLGTRPITGRIVCRLSSLWW